MELGSSLVLNDSLAIMAMIFKPFAVFIPFEFQYFGLWTYICFLLQGIITMKIFHIYTKNKIIILLCGFFFTMLPPFLWRLHGHFGLLGHWLILYAFFIYLSSKEIKRNQKRPQGIKRNQRRSNEIKRNQKKINRNHKNA